MLALAMVAPAATAFPVYLPPQPRHYRAAVTASPFDDSSQWVIRRDVPVFCEHDTRDERREVTDAYGRAVPNPNYGQALHIGAPELSEIADNCNRRETMTGDAVPATLGHTMRGRPETEQPPVIGYFRNFRVARYGAARRLGIVADLWVYKDRSDVLRQYPRRSPEFWTDERILDPIALLGAHTPRLDLGLLLNERSTANRIIYQMDDEEAFMPLLPSQPTLSPQQINDMLPGAPAQYQAPPAMQTPPGVHVPTDMGAARPAGAPGQLPREGDSAAYGTYTTKLTDADHERIAHHLAPHVGHHLMQHMHHYAAHMAPHIAHHLASHPVWQHAHKLYMADQQAAMNPGMPGHPPGPLNPHVPHAAGHAGADPSHTLAPPGGGDPRPAGWDSAHAMPPSPTGQTAPYAGGSAGVTIHPSGGGAPSNPAYPNTQAIPPANTSAHHAAGSTSPSAGPANAGAPPHTGPGLPCGTAQPQYSGYNAGPAAAPHQPLTVTHPSMSGYAGGMPSGTNTMTPTVSGYSLEEQRMHNDQAAIQYRRLEGEVQQLRLENHSLMRRYQREQREKQLIQLEAEGFVLDRPRELEHVAPLDMNRPFMSDQDFAVHTERIKTYYKQAPVPLRDAGAIGGMLNTGPAPIEVPGKPVLTREQRDEAVALYSKGQFKRIEDAYEAVLKGTPATNGAAH